jgi:hypothetical protein
LRAHLGPHRFLAGGIVGEEVEEILGWEILAQAINAAGKKVLPYLRNRGAFSLPDSREIGLAVETRRSRGQIRLAVRCTGNYGIVVTRPTAR